MRILPIVLALLALGGPAAATAGPLPGLDSESHCEEATRLSNGTHTFFKTCLAEETRARRALSGRWADLPPAARRDCLAAARRLGGSYAVLAACLNQEVKDFSPRPPSR